MASRTAGLGTFSDAINGIDSENHLWCCSSSCNTLSWDPFGDVNSATSSKQQRTRSKSLFFQVVGLSAAPSQASCDFLVTTRIFLEEAKAPV
jgi:hypothetical protein